jgi:hypothetical protein
MYVPDRLSALRVRFAHRRLRPGGRGTGRIWADPLTPHSSATRVLLRYRADNAWLTGKPAALGHRYWRGVNLHLGTILNGRLIHAFVAHRLAATVVHSPFGVLPRGVELMRRVGDSCEVVIINHGKRVRTAHLPCAMHDVLHPVGIVRSVHLGSQGVAAPPTTAHQAYSVHTIPHLCNEPKDCERLLHGQMHKVVSRVHHGPFKASSRSLEAYHAPRRFRNAKFGIFVQWGVFSVPAFQNDWYSRNI